MAKEEKPLIQSVDRSLILLKHIAANPGRSHTLSELTEVLSIDRSSVFRLLSTLISHGLVRQEENGKQYRLGYGIFSLASSLRAQEKITTIAAPYLKELVKRTGENAHLAVRSKTSCIFIDRELGSNTLSANTNIGDSEELYCTAVGKSLICDLGLKELEDLLGEVEFTPFTKNTITSIADLLPELAAVREKGYAVDNEEFEQNIQCIGAPVYNFENRIEAAIGVSGPKVRMSSRLEEVGLIVRDAGLSMSRLLGHRQ